MTAFRPFLFANNNHNPNRKARSVCKLSTHRGANLPMSKRAPKNLEALLDSVHHHPQRFQFSLGLGHAVLVFKYRGAFLERVFRDWIKGHVPSDQ